MTVAFVAPHRLGTLQSIKSAPILCIYLLVWSFFASFSTVTMNSAAFVADLIQNVNLFVSQDPQYILDNEPARTKLLSEIRTLQNTLQRPDDAVRNIAFAVSF